MAKYAYVTKGLRGAARATIEQANEIIEDYARQGYRMTLRQLYYQFVSRNLITNEEKSYKKLAHTISDGRLCGLVDWNGIEDRGRAPKKPHFFDSPQRAIEVFKSITETYEIDKWYEQPNYVELWVEKQALASVLEPLAEEHQVVLMVNKGYSSQSAMYEAAQRFNRRRHAKAHRDILLYLGDHDPSGEDMVRDIQDRLAMFETDVTVQKVALTTEQVMKYQPPPNPAKLTDPRSSKYVQKHGDESWELDALPPDVLAQLVTAAIASYRSDKLWKASKALEEKQRRQLALALEKISL